VCGCVCVFACLFASVCMCVFVCVRFGTVCVHVRFATVMSVHVVGSWLCVGEMFWGVQDADIREYIPVPWRKKASMEHWASKVCVCVLLC